MTDLGFPASLESQSIRPLGFPNFNSAGFAAMGKNSFLHQSGTSYTRAGRITKIAGRHSIQGGIDYGINQSSEGVGNDTSGNYSFDRSFTQRPNPNQPANDRGHSIASRHGEPVCPGSTGSAAGPFA